MADRCSLAIDGDLLMLAIEANAVLEGLAIVELKMRLVEA
jgi:hypothetical protein